MIDIADIFREYGEAYCQAHKQPGYILKAIEAILKCRTAELGGHINKCDYCGHQTVLYNSCRNRHCPKCQNMAKEKWLLDRKEDLLPVEYFHVVLTIPNQLNVLALRNQKVIYDILFKAGSEALLELGRDLEHLGAEIGFITLLHTWGQNLMDHPHLHCIVPGGGLAFGESGGISSPHQFFIPFKAISRLFRGKFLYYLKKAFQNGKLKFTGEVLYLNKEQSFKKLLNSLYNQEWVTYCKPPFRDSEQLLEYLGRYTHRVAISNHRIIKFEDGKVTFRWRDYKDNNRIKQMTLNVFEFIRRFLLHILPAGFVKIRQYGILSNRSRCTKLKKCREFLGMATDKTKQKTKLSWEDLLLKLTGIDLRDCPVCGQGKMITHEIFYANRNIPIKSLIFLIKSRDKLTINGNLIIESP